MEGYLAKDKNGKVYYYEKKPVKIEYKEKWICPETIYGVPKCKRIEVPRSAAKHLNLSWNDKQPKKVYVEFYEKPTKDVGEAVAY